MNNITYLEFPAEIHPKPNKDRFHRIVVDDTETQITTWKGLYGNQENTRLVTIPHHNLREVVYVKPKPIFFRGRCRLVYAGDVGQAEQLEFTVINQKQSPKNNFTSSVSERLEKIWLKAKDLSPNHWVLTLSQPKRHRKFFFGLFLFADTLILGSLLSRSTFFLLFLGTFLLCVSLAALSNFSFSTGWHPILKIVASIGVFVVAFILFATAMFLYEMFGLI